MIKIAISGSKGKMGSRIRELAATDPELEVVGSFDAGDDAAFPAGMCDCLIEFTTPQATIEHLRLCETLGKAIVIGTTGLSDAQIEMVRSASAKIPVVFSPNMSIGVNTLFKMIAEAARILGRDYRCEIVEAHHQDKKDAPSGTAKEMMRIVSEIRHEHDLPIESVREGDVVGEHTITFESDLDLIEITHSAKTRDIFVQGALRAAKFLAGKPSGLYTMKDVLGI